MLRIWARGSDGGNKGVRSALVTFQTDGFRRLKIGVAPAEPPRSATDYLVTPFGPAAAAAIDGAVESAARSEERRVGKEVARPGRSRWAPAHIKNNNTVIDLPILQHSKNHIRR